VERILSIWFSFLELFFFTRYFLYASNIRKHSKFFAEVKALNMKYGPLFHLVPKTHNANYFCNSLQKYRNNNNRASIVPFCQGGNL
jgi:hypothetical protein